MVKHLLILLCIPWLCLAQDFYDRPEQGWYWYDEKAQDALVDEKQPLTPAAAQAQLNHLQKELEERKALAIMNPTEENIKQYITLQYEANKRAEFFSTVWEKVVIKNPDLDHSLKNPSNAQARRLFLQEQEEGKKAKVKAFTEKYGLFFFFRSDCRYCHQFAPTLKLFEKNYGMTLIPVSLDGRGLPDYPNPRPDNGISKKLNIDIVPSVIAVDPETGEIIPVTHGLISLDELTYRVDLMSDNKDTMP